MLCDSSLTSSLEWSVTWLISDWPRQATIWYCETQIIGSFVYSLGCFPVLASFGFLFHFPSAFETKLQYDLKCVNFQTELITENTFWTTIKSSWYYSYYPLFVKALVLFWTVGVVHLGITFFYFLFFCLLSVHFFSFTLVFSFHQLVRERVENCLWFCIWEEEEGRGRSLNPYIPV